jgi:antitoxin CptB
MTAAPETPQAQIGRLRIRSWRRGTREMDLILGAFADARLATLDPETLALYDALLAENDHDLYRWVTGADPAPAPYAALVAAIAAEAPGPARRDA